MCHNLFNELRVPFTQLPVLCGEFLSSRLQLGDVNLQLFGIVPGDLQFTSRLLRLGARILTDGSKEIIKKFKMRS